jgi:hypothetical protein
MPHDFGERQVNTRQSRAQQSQLHAAERELARAEEDYQRLRSAYLELAQQEHGHEVALAMLGADMNRAHANLQQLVGLRQLPFRHEPPQAAHREARRMAQQGS